MVEYTGKYFTLDSEIFGTRVNCLEYIDKKGSPQGTCYRCGKLLKRHWYTVQYAEDDVEICNIGTECIKKLT